MRSGLLRAQRFPGEPAAEAFRFKWEQHDTFGSRATRERMREWLWERCGDMTRRLMSDLRRAAARAAAGCSTALSALELLGLPRAGPPLRREGPVREFTDDYARVLFQELDPEDRWRAVMAITKLGRVLGELDTELEVQKPIALLGIPAGRLSVQRRSTGTLKACHHPELTLDEDEPHHLRLVPPSPRTRPVETRAWCDEAQLDVDQQRQRD